MVHTLQIQQYKVAPPTKSNQSSLYRQYSRIRMPMIAFMSLQSSARNINLIKYLVVAEVIQETLERIQFHLFAPTILINQYILIMTKPLLLKSNLPLTLENNKHQVLSVSEIIKRFQTKSPSHKQLVLPVSSSPYKQLIGSPKTATFLLTKAHPTQLKIKAQGSRSDSMKVLGVKMKREGQRGLKVNEVRLQQTNSPKCCGQSINRNGNKKASFTSNSNITKQSQSIVSKLQKQMTKISLASPPTHNPSIPPLNLHNKQNKKIAPLSDRDLNCPLPHSKSGSITSRNHSNVVRHIIKTDYDAFATNHSKPIPSIHCFRKQSNASTLSLRSKHTISTQHLEDYQQLFPKPFSLEGNTEKKTNPLSALRDVKAKIYQQIDSLDKKLLQTTTQDKNRLIKIICRKKKRDKELIDLTQKLELAPSAQLQSEHGEKS